MEGSLPCGFLGFLSPILHVRIPEKHHLSTAGQTDRVWGGETGSLACLCFYWTLRTI